MAAPTITARTPASNSVSQYINTNIVVTFDQAMLEATLTTNTFLMYRTSDYVTMEGTVTYNSSDFSVTFVPYSVLIENTSYTFVVVGVDQSSTCVKNLASESLALTSTWYFETGETAFKSPEGAIPSTQPDEPVACPPTVAVLDSYIESNFSVIKTLPVNYATNQGTRVSGNTVYRAEPSGIWVKFNYPIASGSIPNIDSWITVSAASVNGDPAIPSSAPSGSVNSPAGKYLYWTASDPSGWSANNEVLVTVSENVQSASGTLLGQDEQFMFTTAFDPLYCTANKVKLAIGPYIREVPDDTINRTIYENSMLAYHMANTIYSQGEWDFRSPTYAAKMYTCCKTQHDLLNSELLNRSTGAGQIKRLGDFTVQEQADITGNIKQALIAASSCVNAWLKQLLGKSKRAKASMVVKGISAPSMPPVRGTRTWNEDTAYDTLGANKRSSRANKLPGIYDEWS